MITSIAIILYYIAGGQFEDGSIKLLVASIDFSRPWVLKGFVWLMLFWFYYRFKVLHHRELNVALYDEVNSQRAHPALVYYLEKNLKRPHGVSGGFIVDKLIYQNNTLSALIREVNPLNSVTHYSQLPKEDVSKVWFGGLSLILFAFTARQNPGISSWFAPVALFWVACAMGFFKLSQFLFSIL